MRESLSRGGGLCSGEGSLFRKRDSLLRGGVSIQGRGHCSGGLCPGYRGSVQGRGVSVQGSGSLFREGALCSG